MPYTLIISEKPSAAQRIAQALADDKIEKIGKKIYHFKFKHNGKDMIVVPAVGHLFVLDQKSKSKKWTYPVFDLEWKPTYENKNSQWSKSYYNNISKLVKGADEFISACDYDIEGSTIAFNILRFICKVNDGKRMKFSTLTKEDILDSFNNASTHLDYPQIEAGLTRHTLDFLWGINLSRALTLALEKAKGFWTLSIGRVQGPTLNLLEEREKEIGKFVPELFWTIELKGKVKGEKITANHEKDKFWEKVEAENIFNKCNGKAAKVKSVEKKIVKKAPPIPFDLTTLQRESYNNFGYSPKMTLDVAQSLYEQAVISYPRTSSQKLPQKLGLRKIIEKVGRHRTYAPICDKLLTKAKLVPNEGKKNDAAHPSIFPTGNLPKNLTQYQQKVFDLIVRRFLSTFADAAIREHITAVIDSQGENFKTFGTRTVKANWMEFYGRYAKFKEQLLPEMHEGDVIDVTGLNMEEKETTPPNRYSQASVLKAMEDRNLGTKATRAQILHTLYEREYIMDKSIKVTSLGTAVAEALEKHCPEIISEELTKRFDKEMEIIQEGKRKREDVVSSARQELEKILDKFKEHELHIGNELKEGVKEFQENANYVGVCPKCKGELRILRSHLTGKHFVGCSGYPKCSNSYPLPQRGKLKVGSEKCEKCGLNIVEVKQFKRRPWKLCIQCGFVNAKKKSGKTSAKKKEVKQEKS